MIKKFLIALGVFFTLAALPAAGQTTTVTGTIIDPHGIPYASAQIQASLIPPSGATQLSIGGQVYTGFTFNAATATIPGFFTMNLTDNVALSPAGSKWLFTVCENPGAVIPVGHGSICFSTSITITGPTQDISAILNAIAPALSFIGGGGGSGTVGPGTPGTEAVFNGINSVGNGSCTDDLINPVICPNGIDVVQAGYNVQRANIAPGTVASGVVKEVGGQVTAATAADANNVFGILHRGAGAAGNAEITVLGITACTFSNLTTPNDWVVLDTANAPNCLDTGSQIPVKGIQNFGVVQNVNGGPGTPANVFVYVPGAIISASSSGGGTVLNPFGKTPITDNYIVQASDANHVIHISGTAVGKTVTLPQPGTNGTTTFIQSTSNTVCGAVSSCTTPAITVAPTHTLIVFVRCESGTCGAIGGVTDTAGDTFSPLPGTALNSQPNFFQAAFWAPHSSGGVGLTATASWAGTATNAEVSLAEFQNVIGFDQGAGQVGGFGAGISSPPVTTTAAVELLIAGIQQQCGEPDTPGGGYQVLTAGQFFWQQVGTIGNYVGNLSSACLNNGGGARWGASISTFALNGNAPQFGNGFWIWIANHSNPGQSWTVTATASTITACDGTVGASVTLPAGAQDWFESDGTNWDEECGQGTGGGGSGTVTSLTQAGPIVLTPNPTTTTGTIDCPTCALATGTLTSNAIVLGAGTKNAAVLGSLGTTTTVLHGNAAGAPSFGVVSLTADVGGILPTANGGTGTGSNFAAHTFFGNNTGAPTAPAPVLLTVGDLPITPSGSTTVYATISGALTSGDCVSIDASHNLVDAGVAGCGGGGGGGAVTSVGLALPASLFTVSGSPVTVAGTLTGTLISNATANDVFGNCTGAPATPGFCALTGAMLPNPSASTKGGIESFAAVTHQFLNAISVAGVPSAAQPAFTDISGTLAHSQLPALVSGDIPNNAANTSGNAATATALAAVPTQCTAPQFATGIAANGNANCSTPAGGTIGGSATTNSIPMMSTPTSITTSPLSVTGGGTGVSSSVPFSVPSIIFTGAGTQLVLTGGTGGVVLKGSTGANTDMAARFTLSGGGTATYSFIGTYLTAPACTANDQTPGGVANVTPSGTTGYTVQGTAGHVVTVVCGFFN
jgi:hypothetical protein